MQAVEERPRPPRGSRKSCLKCASDRETWRESVLSVPRLSQVGVHIHLPPTGHEDCRVSHTQCVIDAQACVDRLRVSVMSCLGRREPNGLGKRKGEATIVAVKGGSSTLDSILRRLSLD